MHDDPQRPCVLTKPGKWLSNIGRSTVICGWVRAEIYLRQGYRFDWQATDAMRARIAGADQ
ncbi:hypothetical protein [Rhizorhabdus wittichii]|uniref:hypothetical protein n=1 Tax=Rhizorhabdus wittichii TaxID=160791 RepID=UPI0012FE2B14|nr:hypothetical protein [Rhizorhabdus wittichii]